MGHLTVAEFDIDVTFKDIKNIHLSVHPPLGAVTISAPMHIDSERLRVFAIGKLGWIRRERKKMAEQLREHPKLFITRESHYFLGKRYLLKVTEAKYSNVVLHHNHIELFVPADASTEKKRQVLYLWYRTQLKTLLAQMIVSWERKMGVQHSAIRVQKMKTKWGSCNDKTGMILFNTDLVKKPIDCIEYVVVHELAHLIERKHNRNFVALLDRLLPGWIERKRALNGGEI